MRGMAATSGRRSSMRFGWDVSSDSFGKALHNTRWRAGGPCSRFGMLTAITNAFTLQPLLRRRRKGFQTAALLLTCAHGLSCLLKQRIGSLGILGQHIVG